MSFALDNSVAAAPAATALKLRADYQPSPWLIDSVDLTFDLDPAKTRVLNRMTLRRNPASGDASAALVLDGEDLNLARVLVNGGGAAFRIEDSRLVLPNLPEGSEPVTLEIFTTCAPEKNTQLMGLYISQGTFFTQCEAEGFRRITYYLDRPDVMAAFAVTLRADKAAYPVLLSNGNLVEAGDLDDGRHFARWVDPHKKPCYLFALVAGNLVAREQRITAANGREHLLQVFVRAGDLDKTEHAMRSLVASIAWDEARFGLPLDLDRFMIVATSDFNMGAMENKGLNIFNTKYVLANSATATDADFAHIESVVGHEYFHNWTGNRVTCRDWFQLSLKEGLTVFRDQEFSQDMAGSASARAVKRIEDVRILRTAQFAEDAGPMAHPVRPDSYSEINNFYTLTIYEKGAEVVRMQHNLVGREGFARGMKLYFERHDGQAVTCDDFLAAIADANPGSALDRHRQQFALWYAQAGTPRVRASVRHDAAAQTATLTLAQSCPATPGQSEKQPFVIPVEMGLLDAATGVALPLVLAGDAPSENKAFSRTLVLHEAEQSWTFTGVAAAAVPSLLRGLSAPVILDAGLDDAALLTLLAHDQDAFNRWEAAQQLALRAMLAHIQTAQPSQKQPNDPSGVMPASHTEQVLSADFIAAARAIVADEGLDAALRELLLTPPSQSYIAEQIPHDVDPQRIHAAHHALRVQLARELAPQWQQIWQRHKTAPAHDVGAQAAGQRALANLALQMLCLNAVENPSENKDLWPGRALQRFKDAACMSERFGALAALVHSGHPLAERALALFHRQFATQPLVIDKWFALQATASAQPAQVLAQVRQLMQHADFTLKNPNRTRSLIFSYCSANPAAFHRADGAGYQLWVDAVLALDALNPQVAARLARALEQWRKLAQPYQAAARAAIERVAAADLSGDTREIIHRALDNPNI